jgi:hypothetical protein
VIFGFSHGREPLQLLLFWSFAHGCIEHKGGAPCDDHRRQQSLRPIFSRKVHLCSL